MIIAVDGRMISEPQKFIRYIQPLMNKYPVYVIDNADNIKSDLRKLGVRYKRILFRKSWNIIGIIGLSKRVLRDSFIISVHAMDISDNGIEANMMWYSSVSSEINYSIEREVGLRFL